MTRANQYLEAFKESYNAIALAAAGAASAAFLDARPLLAVIVLEAAYLLFVPDSGWYRARLARRTDAEVQRRRNKLKEETLASLTPDMQARFQQLEELRRQIDDQSGDDREWYREVVRKLDYLIEKFLLFAGKEVQFRTYLTQLLEEVRGAPIRPKVSDDRERFEVRDRRSGGKRNNQDQRLDRNPSFMARSSVPEGEDWVQRTVAEVQGHYSEEQTQLKEAMAAEKDESTQAVLLKRIDVLQRRHEFVGKIGRILTNVHHQLQLVEDTFGLINDEIRARSPEQILADIEEVVVATDSMSSALDELAPYEQMVARASG
jgi:hypothetical protein